MTLSVTQQLQIYELAITGLPLRQCLLSLFGGHLTREQIDHLESDASLRNIHEQAVSEGQRRVREALQRKAQSGDTWAARELRQLSRGRGDAADEEPTTSRDEAPDTSGVVASVHALFARQVELMKQGGQD